MSRLMERWAPVTARAYPTLKSAIYLSAEDVLRMALQAFYATTREMQPPDGRRWLDDDCGAVLEPLPWAGPESLLEGVLHHLGERMRQAAIERGHLVEVPWPEDADEPLAGAGRSPAVKGHGCPAVAVGGLPPAVAVGPAPVPCPEAASSAAVAGCDITTPDDPLFCASTRQELPEVNQADNLETEGELIP